MKTISTIIILFFSFSLNAQDWQWAKVFGSEFAGQGWQGEDYLQMEVDDSGNVYICGMTWPECYFDGDTLYTNDTIWGAQVFLAKYDCSGQRKWITHFGSLNAQETLSMMEYTSMYCLFLTIAVIRLVSQETLLSCRYD